MKKLVLPAAAVAFAVGAKPAEAGGALVFGGVAAALLVLLGLPLGLMLHALRRDWIAAEARAVERRATACVLVGAGLVLLAAFVVAVLSRAPALAVVAVAASVAWFLVGFAGCARLHGSRMLDAAADAASPRTFVLGWLARAGLFAVPVAWPFLGVYVVVVAFGAPVVAMFGRGDKNAPAAT